MKQRGRLYGDSRGLSEVMGTVLLIGMVVVGVGALSVVGSDTISSLNKQAEQKAMVNEFSELASEQARVGYSGSDSAARIDIPREASYMESEITVTAIYENGSSDELYTESVGGVEYSSNGVQYYMQSGGVFMQPDGVRSTVVKSPPSFSYSGETVTFPVLSLSEPSVELGSGKQMRAGSSESNIQMADAKQIRVSASGTNYVGWGRMFAKKLVGMCRIIILQRLLVFCLGILSLVCQTSPLRFP